MDVQYFEIPELPGKRMFRCEKRRASLQPEACQTMWRNGNEKHSHERYWICRGCPIGAMHAGVGDATLSPIYATTICARCGVGTTRLIHGHLCVSCFNREREKIKGRNARGKAPVTHPELHRLSIRYLAGGEVKTLTKSHAIDSLELLVAALRDEPKQSTFTVSPPPCRPTPQLELFL